MKFDEGDTIALSLRTAPIQVSGKFVGLNEDETMVQFRSQNMETKEEALTSLDLSDVNIVVKPLKVSASTSRLHIPR
jgi:hypothetical protein